MSVKNIEFQYLRADTYFNFPFSEILAAINTDYHFLAW